MEEKQDSRNRSHKTKYGWIKRQENIDNQQYFNIFQWLKIKKNNLIRLPRARLQRGISRASFAFDRIG